MTVFSNYEFKPLISLILSLAYLVNIVSWGFGNNYPLYLPLLIIVIVLVRDELQRSLTYKVVTRDTIFLVFLGNLWLITAVIIKFRSQGAMSPLDFRMYNILYFNLILSSVGYVLYNNRVRTYINKDIEKVVTHFLNTELAEIFLELAAIEGTKGIDLTEFKNLQKEARSGNGINPNKGV